jgi:hypothetical protein
MAACPASLYSLDMSVIPRFLDPDFIADKRSQLSKRLEAVLGMLFVFSLVTAASFWDEMAYAGGLATLSGRIGLAVSASACVILLVLSRRKWPLLLCTLLFALLRLPIAWFGSSFPGNLGFLADWTAVSISLSAVVFRIEIAEFMNRVRPNGNRKHSRKRAGPVADSPAASPALVTLSHARTATAPICTIEPLPSSPA